MKCNEVSTRIVMNFNYIINRSCCKLFREIWKPSGCEAEGKAGEGKGNKVSIPWNNFGPIQCKMLLNKKVNVRYFISGII